MPYTAQQTLPYAAGSDTSHEAAVKARDFVGPQGDAVWAYVRGWGLYGATQKEISAGTGIGRASVAARCHALWRQARLEKLDTKREGCAVYIARTV